MERRDFLLGTVTGLGVGVGVTKLAEAVEPDAAPAEGVDVPPTVAPGTVEVGPKPPDGRRLSFAQQGEDLIIKDALDKIGIERPRYLDIGAFHPTISSNTYLLYLGGGTGVLVEPNPFMAEILGKVRPQDTVVNVGVGIGEATQADYYVIRNRPQLNTFSKQQADAYGPDKVERVIEMPLVGINDLLAQHFEGAPDLLSVDVEGLDLQILKTLDFERHRPAVCCVETVVYGTNAIVGETIDLMRSKGYAVRGGTFVNTVFVDEQRLAESAGASARLTL